MSRLPSFPVTTLPSQALRFLTHALLACVCRCFFVLVDEVVLELVDAVLEDEE